MKKKGIILLPIILGVAIVAIIVNDYSSKRPGKSDPNPYEYNIDQYSEVPDHLINYKETRNFNIGFEKPAGIDLDGQRIYITGDSLLKIIDTKGNLLYNIQLPVEAGTVKCGNGKIFIAAGKKIIVFNQNGEKESEWEPVDGNAVITSIAVVDDQVFLADAGGRRVMRFSTSGELMGSFEGKSGNPDLQEFIVPSPNFDIAVNSERELWVVNPGLHSMQNYTFEGDLRGYWEKTGISNEGFSGCCNPAHFTFLEDGRFVTSEKGLVRIKIYKPSGELEGFVAAPSKFKDMGQAPDLASDAEGIVYALDFDKKMVRVFEPKNKNDQ